MLGEKVIFEEFGFGVWYFRGWILGYLMFVWVWGENCVCVVCVIVWGDFEGKGVDWDKDKCGIRCGMG